MTRFNESDAARRLRVIAEIRKRVREDSIRLEKANVKNKAVRKAIRDLRKELTRHIHQLDYSIKKRKEGKSAHYSTASTKTQKEG